MTKMSAVKLQNGDAFYFGPQGLHLQIFDIIVSGDFERIFGKTNKNIICINLICIIFFLTSD